MSESKQFWQFLKTPTIRLTLVHLLIIMTLSICFSVIFYQTSTRPTSPPPQQTRQYAPPESSLNDRYDSDVRAAVEDYLQQRNQELLVRLIWINIAVLFAGTAISYLLARWSIRPIEETMESQIQFVSDASHELRTPLTVLQTTNEVALRKKKLPAAEARQLISHNIEEVKKMKNLTNTLLGLLKDSKKPIVRQAVNLQDVVSDAMSSVVKVAQEKNISIEDKVPRLKVKTDRALLTQIVTILLDNAVKYSDANQQIIISADQPGNKTLLHITDEGIGIRATDLPHIFNRFYRADKSRSSASDVHGYGLGLAIAQKISEQIDARITVKSEINKGSTFTIELPNL